MTTANVRQKENVWTCREEEEEGVMDFNMKSTKTLIKITQTERTASTLGQIKGGN